MSAPHTPGPWEVGPVDDTVVSHVGADGKRYEIAAIDGDYNEPDQWPVMEANARLISAAPDMLEALIEAKREMWISARHQWTMADFKNWAVIQKIDAALTKARGEQE